MFWLQELSSHPIIGAVVCLVLALLALVVRQLAHRTWLRTQLNASFTLMVCGLVIGALAPVARLAGFEAAVPYFHALLAVMVAIGVARAALTIFFDLYFGQRGGGAAVSAILRDVASVIAYFLVVVVVLRSTLDINVASLIATSAALTVIVGLALQDVLGNLFSGLVLEVEQPFAPGDWVRIGAFEGTVTETRWRTTRLCTRVNELVTLPNAVVSKEAVVNFSRPDPRYGDTLHFDAAYEAPPNEVKQAALEVLAEDASVLRVPVPEVRVMQYADSSVKYDIRYWITDFAELEVIRDRLMTRLWYAFQRADLRMPYPVRDLFIHTAAPAIPVLDRAAVVSTLRRVSLLRPLGDAELARLAQAVRRETFGAGEVIVSQGEPGDSFYVIERGSAEVLLGADGVTQSVGTLRAEDFFGEMSLLAGDARTATVRAASDLTVLVVDHAAFKEIISADPAILEPLSEIAAQRQASQQEHRRSRASARATLADAQGAQRLRERIKAFFGL